jgi:hypothetical protein
MPRATTIFKLLVCNIQLIRREINALQTIYALAALFEELIHFFQEMIDCPDFPRIAIIS